LDCRIFEMLITGAGEHDHSVPVVRAEVSEGSMQIREASESRVEGPRWRGPLESKESPGDDESGGIVVVTEECDHFSNRS
jgi:hypothetical protein